MRRGNLHEIEEVGESTLCVSRSAFASDVSAESGQTCADNLVLLQVMLQQVTVSCPPGLQPSLGCSTSFSPQTEHNSIPQKTLNEESG